MRKASLFCVLALAAGCSPGRTTTPHGQRTFSGTHPIKAVATTAMVGDLVRNVGGSHVAVTDLFKAGVDPHTYRATTEDVRLLKNADMVFFNGLHLEGKMGEVFEKLQQQVPSLAVADTLKSPKSAAVRPLLTDGEHPDPHVWFDVSMWASLADAVAESLAKFDPPHAAEYRDNARKYADRLKSLDGEITGQLAAIPKEKRVLVTSHDAFRYFGRAYGVDVRGIQGVSTESEASVGHITELVDFLSKAKVKAVFVESSVSPRNMQALIEGCAARGHKVVQGGELFSDAMGDPGTVEGTYEGMIRHNVKTIVEALK